MCGRLCWLASQQSDHPLAAPTAGFFSSYNNSALAPNITAEVKRLAALFPDLPLYIGGHSMGAAMAHMCALDLRYNANMSQVHVYTYGSPRVGNTQFYDFFNASVEVRLPKLGVIVTTHQGAAERPWQLQTGCLSMMCSCWLFEHGVGTR